jgi:hypothetical protein
MYARSLQETRSHCGGDDKHCHAYDTCIVVDICQWTDDMTVCTKHRFPDTELRIVHSSASLTGFGVVVKLHSLQGPRAAVSRHHHHDDDQSSVAKGQSIIKSADPECSKPTSMPRRVFQRVFVILSLWMGRCVQVPVNACTLVYMQRSSITGLAVCACTVYVFICIIGFIQSFDSSQAQ